MKNKLKLIISIFLICITVYIYIILKLNINDSLIYKIEYDISYNQENFTYSLQTHNLIKNLNYEELKNFLKNGTGILYIGQVDFQYDRNLVPILFDVLNNNNVKQLYYFEISEISPRYILVNDEVEYYIDSQNNICNGTREYYELLYILNDYLNIGVVIFDDKIYDLHRKSIYTPYILILNDGHIIDYKISIPEEYAYQTLDNIKSKKLYDIYNEFIQKNIEVIK